jgi:hypothetical protein
MAAVRRQSETADTAGARRSGAHDTRDGGGAGGAAGTDVVGAGGAAGIDRAAGAAGTDEAAAGTDGAGGVVSTIIHAPRSGVARACCDFQISQCCWRGNRTRILDVLTLT